MTSKGLSIVFLLVMGAVLPMTISVAAEQEFGCLRGDCIDGRGTLVEETERGVVSYVGNFADGAYHGYGQISYLDEGLFYKGNWKLGKRSGRGILWDKANNVYMGAWLNDRRNGQGAQYYHVQGWKEGLHGEDWLVDNTENYTGSFQNDVFYGVGTYRWPDGVKYVGSWVANKKHGDGYFDYGTGNRAYRKFEFDVKVFE